MKIVACFLIFLSAWLLAGFAFSYCGGSGYFYGAGECSSRGSMYPTGCGGGGYGSSCGDWGAASGCGPRCIYDSYCQCADPGVDYNPCIDRCTYCEAFGNIGAR